MQNEKVCVLQFGQLSFYLTEQVGSSSTASDICLASDQLKPWTDTDCPDLGFLNFPQSLQANADIVFLTPWPLPSASYQFSSLNC
jgi:hypothetical protein